LKIKYKNIASNSSPAYSAGQNVRPRSHCAFDGNWTQN